MPDESRKSLTTTVPLHKRIRQMAFRRDHLMSRETDLVIREGLGAIEAQLAKQRADLRNGKKLPKGRVRA